MNFLYSRPVFLNSLLCLLLFMILPSASAEPGDVNGDGSISLADATLVENDILGLSVLTSDSITRADSNQNDKIDVGDLIYVFNNLSLLTIYLPGNVPLELVRIPSGSFQMGSPNTERSRSGVEEPVHTVDINYSFYMGKYEITQAQWRAVMGSNPTHDYGVGDNYPVYYVTWNAIAASGGFLERLNQHLSATGQGHQVRLPSESEWEYACRAGTTTRFYFGDSLGCDDYTCDDCAAGTLAGNRSDYMWYCFSSTTPSKPVGQKLPNAFGLFDMHGNIWEWCQDWYHSSYTGAPADGTAWESPAGSLRVLRGGSWGDLPGNCRSAFRGGDDPGYAVNYYGYGFRVSVSP